MIYLIENEEENTRLVYAYFLVLEYPRGYQCSTWSSCIEAHDYLISSPNLTKVEALGKKTRSDTAFC